MNPAARIMLGIIFPSTTYPLFTYTLILKCGTNRIAYGHRRHGILSGNQVGDGVNALLNKDRIVTVKGLCEKEVKANHVIWPLSFNEMGNDLATVYDNLEKKQSTVFEFLKKGGIEPSEISLAAPKVNDTLANNYGPNRPPFRYIFTQVITIATDKVDTVR